MYLILLLNFQEQKKHIKSAYSKELEEILDSNTFGDDITLVSKRQVLAVENTLYNIGLAKEPLKSGELEFFAHFITQALEDISSITKTFMTTTKC